MVSIQVPAIHKCVCVFVVLGLPSTALIIRAQATHKVRLNDKEGTYEKYDNIFCKTIPCMIYYYK